MSPLLLTRNLRVTYFTDTSSMGPQTYSLSSVVDPRRRSASPRAVTVNLETAFVRGAFGSGEGQGCEMAPETKTKQINKLRPRVHLCLSAPLLPRTAPSAPAPPTCTVSRGQGVISPSLCRCRRRRRPRIRIRRRDGRRVLLEQSITRTPFATRDAARHGRRAARKRTTGARAPALSRSRRRAFRAIRERRRVYPSRDDRPLSAYSVVLRRPRTAAVVQRVPRALSDWTRPEADTSRTRRPGPETRSRRSRQPRCCRERTAGLVSGEQMTQRCAHRILGGDVRPHA